MILAARYQLVNAESALPLELYMVLQELYERLQNIETQEPITRGVM